LKPAGIEAFSCREVQPYNPESWIDTETTKVGYEIAFTHYCYKPQLLRNVQEIRADIALWNRRRKDCCIRFW